MAAGINDTITYYNESDANEIPSLIDESSSTLIFVGYTLMSNQAQGGAVWKVKRIRQSGTVWQIQYANGGTYDNIWTNRASLTYY